MNNPSPRAPGAKRAPKRPRKVEVGAFGRLLARLRLRLRRTHKYTTDRVAEILTNDDAKTSGGSLRGYEKGWNKTIDPVVLAGLARLYQFPLDDLVTVLKANRARPEMTDIEVQQVLQRARRKRHGEAAAAARFAEIGARLQTLAGELVQFSNDAAELTGTTDRPREPPSEGSERAADADPDR